MQKQLNMHIKPWIEALRLRTLPVSAAGVIAGCSVALAYGNFEWMPALICLVFALVAQIVSNLANEYYDFKNGIDKKGREGFRRGVTEGDIKPSEMKTLMITLMALDCLLGCTLIYWGGFWLVPVGILIVTAAFAYSAGPWPLSHHGLGDELVVIFYGIVPVTLTAYLQCGDWTGGSAASYIGPMWKMALLASVGVGLLGDNVLTVNNIRDAKEDKKVGKRTKAVILGVPAMRIAYILCYLTGAGLVFYAFHAALPEWAWIGYGVITIWYALLVQALYVFEGKSLNKVLKFTSVMLLVIILWTLVCVVLHHNQLIPEHNPNCLIHHLMGYNYEI